MKIALVCPYNMIQNAGGVAQVILSLKDDLVKNGHTVKIITPRPSGYKGKAPKDHILLGVINNTKFGPGLATGGSWTFNIDNDEVKKVLDAEKFDLINFHEPWAPILARQILSISNAAHVGTFHANLSDSIAAKSLVNLFLPYGRGIAEKLDLITAVSPAPAAVLLEKDSNHRLVKNLKYIPNSINVRKFKNRPKNAIKHPTVKTILYVGRLEGRKGIKYLLQAFKELSNQHEDVQLFIAGKGPDDKKLREYVEEQEIPRVTFLGYITEEDKIYHLHRADVFCSPAHRGESFGIVLLEAMATGCPVVAGDNIGYQSALTGTGAISLVNPKDTIDFARRLELMCFDAALRRLWIRWARRHVKQFDTAQIVKKYEAAYKEALVLHEARQSS